MKIDTVIVERVQFNYLSDEAEADSEVWCAGCSAPCCRARHLDAVPLSRGEASRLPHHFGSARLQNGRQVENVALLSRHPLTGACIFYVERPGGAGGCSIYPVRPKACRVYDCRHDADPEMKAFARERFGTR